MQSPGDVSYAGLCHTRKGRGLHLVMHAEQGPVTVFLMPGELIDKQHRVADERFQGVVVPYNSGSLAIIGEHPEAVDAVTNQVVNSLSWKS